MTAAGREPAPALEAVGLTVSYGRRPVLRDLDLAVCAGEAMAVLGPSGCGKTTLLYTVAGFTAPDSGLIRIDGRVVVDGPRSHPPEDRDVAVVFQNYALWPHLSALDTVAYPIRRAGQPRAEARQRAMVLLERMGVAALADRRPAELSGGEQQRVGVARALARGAALYLFDEPTAHLDAPLRTVLQEELAAQRTALGAAVLYATHDVAEAFTVADRVALLRGGAVAQIGSPQQVYEHPVDLWAARLTGPACALDLPVAPAGPGSIEVWVGEVAATVAVAGGREPPAGRAALLLRPEWGGLGGPLPGRVLAVRYRGPDTIYRLDTPAGQVEVRGGGAPRAAIGERCGWAMQRVGLLPGPASAAAPHPVSRG